MMSEERGGGWVVMDKVGNGGTIWKEAQVKPHVFILFHAPQSNNQQNRWWEVVTIKKKWGRGGLN